MIPRIADSWYKRTANLVLGTRGGKEFACEGLVCRLCLEGRPKERYQRENVERAVIGGEWLPKIAASAAWQAEI